MSDPILTENKNPFATEDGACCRPTGTRVRTPPTVGTRPQPHSETDYEVVPAPKDLRSLHFIGIGGAGMSGIALVLHNRGYKVTGSDLKPSRYVTLLENAGLPVAIGHRAANIDHPDVVVISSAIPPHNVELQEARRRGIPVVKRAQALAWTMESGRGIAVCGTHGKTTTTSM